MHMNAYIYTHIYIKCDSKPNTLSLCSPPVCAQGLQMLNRSFLIIFRCMMLLSIMSAFQRTFCQKPYVHQLSAGRHSDTWLDHILRPNFIKFKRRKRDFVKPCSVSQAMLPHHKAALHSFQSKWRKLCLSYLGWAILWVFQHHFMMTENYREYSEISDSKRNLEKKGYFQQKLFILC